MKETFERAGVIPVLVFPQPQHAAPTASALIGGGLTVLEVTLRTEAAWQALDAIVQAHPEAVVGVGTVLEPEQMLRARDAGARFAVSPGFEPVLAEAAAAMGLFYLPGVATASEVMQARRAGHRFLKLFPAGPAGGRALLQSLASPFGDIVFCPTGGINAGSLSDYLALPNVACVGGSWVATEQDMAAADWQAIGKKAAAARAAADNR